jgi:ubiquinone/menaquinone biosynthesis C-methylase UbiE
MTDRQDFRMSERPPAPGPRPRDAAFAGIAAAYARWRPGYHEGFYTALHRVFGLDGTLRVLDVGCGPGTIGLHLAAVAGEVVGVDPVPQMLGQAARLAAAAGLGHRIRWVQGTAEDLPRLGLGVFDLVTVGSALYWMDAPRLLRDLDELVVPGGGVAIVSGTRPADYPRPVWQCAADEVRRRWIGPEPAPRPAVVASVVDYVELLDASAFTDIVHTAWEEPIDRTLEAVIGLQYSYAATAPTALGADQVGYELDLRRALLNACPGGIFTDRRRTEAWMATRPQPLNQERSR